MRKQNILGLLKKYVEENQAGIAFGLMACFGQADYQTYAMMKKEAGLR